MSHLLSLETSDGNNIIAVGAILSPRTDTWAQQSCKDMQAQLYICSIYLISLYAEKKRFVALMKI